MPARESGLPVGDDEQVTQEGPLTPASLARRVTVSWYGSSAARRVDPDQNQLCQAGGDGGRIKGDLYWDIRGGSLLADRGADSVSIDPQA